MFDNIKKFLNESQHPFVNMSDSFKENFIENKELVIWGFLTGALLLLCMNFFSYFIKQTSSFLFYHFDISSLETIYITDLDNFQNLYLLGIILLFLYTGILVRILNILMYLSYKISIWFVDEDELNENINEKINEFMSDKYVESENSMS